MSESITAIRLEMKGDIEKSEKRIMKAIVDLKSDMKEDMRKMHEKQDKTNGKVMKNTQWRLIAVGALIVINAWVLPVAWDIGKEIIKKFL